MKIVCVIGNQPAITNHLKTLDDVVVVSGRSHIEVTEIKATQDKLFADKLYIQKSEKLNYRDLENQRRKKW